MSNRINTAVWLEEYHRWQIKVRKDGQRKTFTSPIPGRKGQRECNKKADDWLNGITINPSVKVGILWDRFVQSLKDAGTSKSHWGQYEQYGRNYVSKVIWHRKVASLTEQDLQNVIDYAHKHPVGGKLLSRKTFKNIRNALSSFMKYARKNGISSLRPEFLTLPNDAPKPEKHPLQPDDLRKLFASSETTYRGKIVEEWYIHAYRFAAITGLRPGELYRLEATNVNTKTGLCRVRGAVNVYNEETEGKNANAIRNFKLPSLAIAEVKEQREMLKRAGVISPYLFPEPDGSITRQSVAYIHWVRYRNHNGIADISPYELRHTFFSVNKSLPKELVKMVGGHSDDFDTFGTYGHELEGEMDQAAALINDSFSQVLKRG